MDLDAAEATGTKATAGINKHKQAAAVTEKRLGSLKRNMEKMMQAQSNANDNINKLTQTQKTTSNNTDKLMVAIQANKRETDRNHIETVGIMNRFQASLNNLTASMHDANAAMANLNAKAGVTATLNEGEIHFSSNQLGNAGPQPDMWEQESFIIDDEDEININDSHLNETFSSDAMNSAADNK